MDRYKYAIYDALCDVADERNISIYKLLLKSDTPDVASPVDDSVIMNPNFETQVTYNYRLAHELSHIIYGDADAQSVYQFSEYGKRGEELLAHRNAIRMLMSIEIPSSPLTFMNYYHVPAWLEIDVIQTYNKFKVIE